MNGAFSSMLVASILLSCLGYTHSSAQFLDATLDASDQQLDALTHRVLSLSNQLDEILTERDDAELQAKRFSKKLDHEEGKTGGCKKGFFPCGSAPYGTVQCVRDYLVCDGSADCKNGADEVDGICGHMPFVLPLQRKGEILAACKADFIPSSDIPTVLSVNAADVIPWFPSRPKITWTLGFPFTTAQATMRMYLPEYGVYDYATGNVIGEYEPRVGLSGYIRSDQVTVDTLQFIGDVSRFAEEKPCGATVWV